MSCRLNESLILVEYHPFLVLDFTLRVHLSLFRLLFNYNLSIVHINRNKLFVCPLTIIIKMVGILNGENHFHFIIYKNM